MEMRTVARHVVRLGRDRKACLYYAACVVLLIVAAGLRFHDLSEKSVWYDEVALAQLSGDTFPKTVFYTRYHNSSPILYPLVLYAVQKVESTPFSIRVLPATASVLTVAVMLFLLPRLGVARGAAFLAALPATLSAAAIENAQDARENSIDALLAVLMIAGLLWYLRDGRKALLCLSLFLAPLLQYGLVLFGAALMSAATVLPPPPPTLATPEGDSRPSRIRHWFQRRIALVWPAGCFLAGCAISYAVTLRYQWQEGGFASKSYLQKNYYQGKFEAHSIFEFSIDGTWGLLTYHLPWVVATAALAAFALLLVAAFLGKFQGKFQDSAIAVVFSFVFVASVGAAVLGIYPLGDIRQVTYLGPVVFLAVGGAFQSSADALVSTARRAWPRSLMILLFASIIVLAGENAIRRANVYWPDDKIDDIYAVLQDSSREQDVYFYSTRMRDHMKFHQKYEIGKVVSNENIFDFTSETCSRETIEICFQEMIAKITPLTERNRLWLITENPWLSLEVLQTLLPHNSIEHVVSGGRPNLHLIKDMESLIQISTTTDIKSISPHKPLIRSTFDIYLHDNTLIYVKMPCVRADTEATFFLHPTPADMADLPDHRKQYGFDNLDFGFGERGVNFGDKCMARVPLPKYDISEIRTGQFLANEDGSWKTWEEEIRFDE